MGTLDLGLDLHTEDRLDALLLLLREADPTFPWDRQEVLRRVLDQGLRMMLAEMLMNGRRRSNAREGSAKNRVMKRDTTQDSPLLIRGLIHADAKQGLGDF